MVEMVGTNGKYTIGKDATNGGTGAGGGGRAQRVGNSSSSYSKAGNGGDGLLLSNGKEVEM